MRELFNSFRDMVIQILVSSSVALVILTIIAGLAILVYGIFWAVFAVLLNVPAWAAVVFTGAWAALTLYFSVTYDF